MKSAAKSIGSSLGRRIIRGIMGTLLGRKSNKHFPLLMLCLLSIHQYMLHLSLQRRFYYE